MTLYFESHFRVVFSTGNVLQDYLCRTNKSDDQNVYTSSVKNMKKKLRSLFSVGLTIVDYSDKGHYLKTDRFGTS